MTRRVLRVATRGSDLALAQSGAIARRVAKTLGCEAELVVITTSGDVPLPLLYQQSAALTICSLT